MLIVLSFANICPNFSVLYRYYYDDHLKFSKFQIGIVDTMKPLGLMLSSWVFYKFCKKSNLTQVFIWTLVFVFVSKVFLIPGIIDGVIDSSNARFGMISFQNFNQNFFMTFNLNPLFTLWIKGCPDHFLGTSITVLTGFVNIYTMLSTVFASLVVWMLDIAIKNFSKIWVPVFLENIFMLITLILVALLLLGVKKPDYRSLEKA